MTGRIPAAPVEAPTEIKPETGLDPGVEGVAGGVEGGVPAASSAASSAVCPKRPRRPRRRQPAPVRVGGQIKPPTRCKNVKPVYPPIAQSARVQGVVILEATIGPEGKVKDAKVLRSIPLLDAGGDRRRQAVGVHADAAERRAGAGHHDRHGELPSAVLAAER